MSCGVCNGHPGCPCCGEEPHMIECPDCDGKGHAYYNETGDEITEEEYNANPSDFEKVPCDRCEGAGEIEYDYEPDYDNYND